MNYLKYLENGNNCVILKENIIIYSSKYIGIRPILELVDSKIDVSGCVAVDKIVGRAAAMLYVYLGISEIHAHVMSEGAKIYLSEHGVAAFSEKITEKIINRTGDDICPMEKSVIGINDSHKAIEAIRKKLAELGGSKK